MALMMLSVTQTKSRRDTHPLAWGSDCRVKGEAACLEDGQLCRVGTLAIGLPHLGKEHNTQGRVLLVERTNQTSQCECCLLCDGEGSTRTSREAIEIRLIQGNTIDSNKDSKERETNRLAVSLAATL